MSTGRKGAQSKQLAKRPTLQFLAAENAIDLGAARAVFTRAGGLIDAYRADHLAVPASLDEAHAVFQEVQAAKTFVHEAAIRIVGRAMTMSGGAGFMNKHRLSRPYRDVRAGPFLHPLGANVVREYIGQVALGLEPSIN